MVECLRIFFCQILVEHVVASRCKSVAAHSTVVSVLVSGLSTRRESHDYVARSNVSIVYHVATFHSASHGRVNDDGSHEVSHVSRLSTSGINADAHVPHLSEQFVSPVDDGRDHLSRHEHFVSSYSA